MIMFNCSNFLEIVLPCKCFCFLVCDAFFYPPPAWRWSKFHNCTMDVGVCCSMPFLASRSSPHIAWKSAGLHQEIPEILTTIVWTSAMAARNVWKALSQGNMKPYHVKKNLQLLQLSRFSNGLWLWQKAFGSAQLLFFRHKAGLQHCDICQLLSVICLFSGHSRGRPGTLGHLPSGFQSKACADGTAQRGASK